MSRTRWSFGALAERASERTANLGARLRIWRQPADRAQLAVAPGEPWLPTSADEQRALRRRLATLNDAPRFVCVVLAERATAQEVCLTLRSLFGVVYDRWQAVTIGGGQATTSVTSLPERNLPFIAIRAETRSQVADALEHTLAESDADYVLFLEAGDCLAADALVAAAEHLNDIPAVDLLYGDEDTLDGHGCLVDAYHKPDSSPALLLSQPYIAAGAFYRREPLVQAGGLRPEWESAALYDLALHFTERASSIAHLPHVVCHRHRGRANQVDLRRNRAVVEAALARRKIAASIEARRGGTLVVSPRPHRYERVTIVLPTRNGGSRLAVAVESVLTQTDYPDFELLVVDNGSTDRETRESLRQLSGHSQVRVLEDLRPFNFSAINNAAVRQTGAPLILLLNDDTEVISRDWLASMVGWIEQPSVGAVGAKLLYTNGTVQHAGIVLGIGGVASHAHKRFSRFDAGYHGLLDSVHECSAVTGACLLTRRDLFWQVGGLEEALPRAYNDVDYCLKLRERGCRVLYTPAAELYHHESASRGRDRRDDAQFRQAILWMQQRWGPTLLDDPYYHPKLSLRATNFAPRRAA